MSHESYRPSSLSDSFAHMERREFLRIGSVAMVGIAATSLPAAILRTSALPTSLSIGYAGSAGTTLRNPISASALAAGDRHFVGSTARVAVRGFWRGERSDAPLAVELTAYYPTSAVDGKSPFVAWTYRSNKHGAISAPGSFRLPVERDGIDLAVRASAPQVPAFVPVSAEQPKPLMPDRECEGMLMNLGLTRAADGRILEGTYIVALLEPGVRPPSWGLMEFDHAMTAFDVNSGGPLRASILSGSTRVPFDYLVLSIQRTA